MPRSTDERGPLTAYQLQQFARDGFLVLDTPQIGRTEVESCRDLLMSLFERQAGRREGRSFDISARTGGADGPTPQLFRPSLYAKELSVWPYRKIGLAIARQLLGSEATLAADNAVFKPARIGGRTPWHQDEAHNDPHSYQEQVTIWIAMFDTTVANGAMAFIPGSHLHGILPHRPNGGAADANAIECCGDFDPTQARICPLPAGGLTIHHGLTVHGAAENRSAGPRLGYILNYKNPPRPRPELGPFPWKGQVGKSIWRRRKSWLMHGGFFVELLRFCRSDSDNRRHFIAQVLRRFKH